MARMDWTRTFVEASGFRPTASEAFMPIKPTPMAAPSAARPTVKFPVISSILRFLATPAMEHGQAVKIFDSIVCDCGPFFMLTNQQREDSRQQHEHQGLHQSHQQFQEIKWNRHQPAKAG